MNLEKSSFQKCDKWKPDHIMTLLKLSDFRETKNILPEEEITSEDQISCYFCKKTAEEAETMIKCKGIIICSHCVKAFHGLLKEKYPASVVNNAPIAGWYLE